VSLSRKRFGVLRPHFAGFDGARRTISVIFCRILPTSCFIHDILQDIFGGRVRVLSLSQKQFTRSISNLAGPNRQPMSISGIFFQNFCRHRSAVPCIIIYCVKTNDTSRAPQRLSMWPKRSPYIIHTRPPDTPRPRRPPPAPYNFPI
jgi:hypothetical protein